MEIWCILCSIYSDKFQNILLSPNFHPFSFLVIWKTKVIFIPFILGHEKCVLNCRPKGVNLLKRWADKVVDGTTCTVDSYDICVDGRCEVWVTEFSCHLIEVIHWSEHAIFKLIYLSGGCVSKRVREENLSYEMDFDLFENEPLVGARVHLNGIGLSLALPQRQKATPKWPISATIKYWKVVDQIKWHLPRIIIEAVSCLLLNQTTA